MKAVALSHVCIASSCILVASSHVCIASSCVGLHSTHCGTGSLTVIEYGSKDGSLPFPLTVTGHMVLS